MNDRKHEIEIARHFAAALDSCDYARAAQYVAEDCRYSRPAEEELVGPEAILATYRECNAKACRDFDSVHYRSEAGSNISGGIQLMFFDELRCGRVAHTFRCSQIVYFNENQKITRIELVELPGERERLREFCERHANRVSPS